MTYKWWVELFIQDDIVDMFALAFVKVLKGPGNLAKWHFRNQGILFRNFGGIPELNLDKISPGIVINHVDRSFHVLIVTTGDISMIPSFEIWSHMLLELLHCYPVGIYAESNHRNKLWMELKPHWFKNALARNGFPGTCTKFMMTSSNGNIFCVIFPLWHVCSGFLGTLKIREFLKMALEK